MPRAIDFAIQRQLHNTAQHLAFFTLHKAALNPLKHTVDIPVALM